jgi:hypothetical protein
METVIKTIVKGKTEFQGRENDQQGNNRVIAPLGEFHSQPLFAQAQTMLPSARRRRPYSGSFSRCMRLMGLLPDLRSVRFYGAR